MVAVTILLIDSLLTFLFFALATKGFKNLSSIPFFISPENIRSFISFKNCPLLSSVVLFKNDFTSGNILSTSWSIRLTCSIEKLVSPIRLPCSFILAKNNSCGLLPLGLNAEPTPSKNLSNFLLLYASSLPLCPSALIPAPAPAKRYVMGSASAPNFTLFNIFLPASVLGSKSTSLSNSVGPASNTSPIVPILSTSATVVSPNAPPNAIAANFCLLFNAFSSDAFFTPFFKLSALRFKYCPVFLAFNAFVANLVASLAPIPAGKPICVITSVSLPNALCSATSSNGFILSKNFSTSTAYSVPKPKSISSAPNDTIPSGTLIKPDAMPATPAVIELTS